MFKLCVNPTFGLGEGGRERGLVFVVEVGNRMEGSLPASHIGLMRDGFWVGVNLGEITVEMPWCVLVLLTVHFLIY